MSNERTITIFCAKEQADTLHTGQVDLNGELVFTCTTCDGFIKVPAGMSVEDIKTHLAEHKEANEGQINIAESQDTLDSLFDSEE